MEQINKIRIKNWYNASLSIWIFEYFNIRTEIWKYNLTFLVRFSFHDHTKKRKFR